MRLLDPTLPPHGFLPGIAAYSHLSSFVISPTPSAGKLALADKAMAKATRIHNEQLASWNLF